MPRSPKSKSSLQRFGLKRLIALGILALVYQGFSYTQTKQDAKIGPLEIQHQETHDVPVPPIVGAVCIVAGAAALFVGSRKV